MTIVRGRNLVGFFGFRHLLFVGTIRSFTAFCVIGRMSQSVELWRLDVKSGEREAVFPADLPGKCPSMISGAYGRDVDRPGACYPTIPALGTAAIGRTLPSERCYGDPVCGRSARRGEGFVLKFRIRNTPGSRLVNSEEFDLARRYSGIVRAFDAAGPINLGQKFCL